MQLEMIFPTKICVVIIFVFNLKKIWKSHWQYFIIYIIKNCNFNSIFTFRDEKETKFGLVQTVVYKFDPNLYYDIYVNFIGREMFQVN